MARKAQISVEYLMNYAVALLVIVIALAGLNYLGIFRILGSPPEVCMFQQGMDCGGSPLLPQGSKLELTGVNEEGDTIVITGVMCSSEPVNPATGLPKNMWALGFGSTVDRGWENPADSVYPSTVEDGTNFEMKVDCYKPDGKDTDTLSQGEGYTGLVYVQYHKASSGSDFSHVILANVQTPVQPPTPCPASCKCGCNEAPTCRACVCNYAKCQGCCKNPPICNPLPQCSPACRSNEVCKVTRTITVDTCIDDECTIGGCWVTAKCEKKAKCPSCVMCHTYGDILMCKLGLDCECGTHPWFS
ncbi:MAG: hypothetical protein NT157_02815 [Candidatus Micrarchaeota archaeon]|nr:hypothetical protein [Candidatus Micrarchaeota archaeon]